MAYTTTYPGDIDVIKAGPNCDNCVAARSGECEAYRAFMAVTQLGEKALDSFTPGLRSTGREVSDAMVLCSGAEEADQFLLKDSMDHGSDASRVRVILATSGRVFRDSGGTGPFPAPRPLEWEKHILRPGRPTDRTASGLWKEIVPTVADPASQSA